MSEDTPSGDGIPEQAPSEPQLFVKRHIQYCKRTLGVLPSAVQSLDTSRSHSLPSLFPKAV